MVKPIAVAGEILTGLGYAAQTAFEHVGMSAADALLSSRGMVKQAARVRASQSAQGPANGVVMIAVGLLDHKPRVVAYGTLQAITSYLGKRHGAMVGADLAAAFRR